MKKVAIFCLSLCIILNLFTGFVSAEEEISADLSVAGYRGIDATTPILGGKKLVENITSGFLYDANSETLMYAYEADKQVYPASLVKIMTALYALENGKLTDIAVVSDVALSSFPIDAVNVRLKVGEQMSLEDLLYCLLVSSANDAAAVIAEHISGDQETFVANMNEYAKTLGCDATTFVNSHGLHHESQVTTARDIARILNAALKNETFRKIFTSKTHRIEATNLSDIRKLETSNALLDNTSKYYDGRAIGGRTGVTDDGKRCMAAVAEANGMQLISVVMGSESVYQEDGYSAISVGSYMETKALLDAGFGGYQTAQILYANQALQQCKVENGDSDLVVGPKESVLSVLPANATVNNLTYHYKTDVLTAPIFKGDKVSHVQIWSGSMCVAEAELYALNSVAVDSQMLSSDTEKTSNINSGTVITLTIVGVVVLALFILVVVRYLPRLMVKKRSAQHRRSRRRS